MGWNARPKWAVKPARELMAIAVAIVSLALFSVAWSQEPVPKQPVPAPASDQVDSTKSVSRPAEQLNPDQRNQLLELQHKQSLQGVVIYGSFLVISCVVGFLLYYMTTLRDKLADSTDADTRQLFPHMALGLPDGSVRAGIAIIIVLGTLLSIMASGVTDLGLKFPEALTGVLGTILGFYFGRSGAADTVQASKAIVQAATADAKDQARQATQALEGNQRVYSADIAAQAGPIFTAAKAAIDAFHPDQSAKLLDDLARAQAAAGAAQTANKPEELKAALDGFQRDGPIAGIVRSFGPALAPLVPGGTTAAALQALAAVSERLAPAAAQHWVARLLNAPYRDGLIAPVIDDVYASRLITDVPPAQGLVSFLQANRPSTAAANAAPLTPTEIVKLVLREDAVASMADMWHQQQSFAANWGPVIEALQRRALEIELEGEVPADLIKPFGGFSTFFKALDGVQATGAAGLQALDFLMSTVRAARQAGASAADVLPPAATAS